jgi:hypothetical protein
MSGRLAVPQELADERVPLGVHVPTPQIGLLQHGREHLANCWRRQDGLPTQDTSDVPVRVGASLQCALRLIAERTEIELKDRRKPFERRDHELGCHQEEYLEIFGLRLVVESDDLAIVSVNVPFEIADTCMHRIAQNRIC